MIFPGFPGVLSFLLEGFPCRVETLNKNKEGIPRLTLRQETELGQVVQCWVDDVHVGTVQTMFKHRHKLMRTPDKLQKKIQLGEVSF